MATIHKPAFYQETSFVKKKGGTLYKIVNWLSSIYTVKRARPENEITEEEAAKLLYSLSHPRTLPQHVKDIAQSIKNTKVVD